MSSMRNAVQRRNHKERDQPQERRKWGLLEKHKDYSKRAADHNIKKRKLSALKQKAADRNEDEFAFGMMRSQTEGGVKMAGRGPDNSGGGGKSLTHEVVSLMKTQDASYLRTVLQSTKRKRERLEEEVVIGNIGVQRPSNQRRLVFDEVGAAIRGVVGDDDTELQDVSALREDEDSNSSSEDDEDKLPQDPLQRGRLHGQKLRQRRLTGIRERERDLSTALHELETQRARMNGSVGGVNKHGIEFKIRQRKR